MNIAGMSVARFRGQRVGPNVHNIIAKIVTTTNKSKQNMSGNRLTGAIAMRIQVLTIHLTVHKINVL